MPPYSSPVFNIPGATGARPNVIGNPNDPNEQRRRAIAQTFGLLGARRMAGPAALPVGSVSKGGIGVSGSGVSGVGSTNSGSGGPQQGNFNAGGVSVQKLQELLKVLMGGGADLTDLKPFLQSPAMLQLMLASQKLPMGPSGSPYRVFRRPSYMRGG